MHGGRNQGPRVREIARLVAAFIFSGRRSSIDGARKQCIEIRRRTTGTANRERRPRRRQVKACDEGLRVAESAGARRRWCWGVRGKTEDMLLYELDEVFEVVQACSLGSIVGRGDEVVDE